VTSSAQILRADLRPPLSIALSVALEALDVRLCGELHDLRSRGALTFDELRGLYVGPERVERMLAGHETDRSAQTTARERHALSDSLAMQPAWRAMARDLAHTPLECDLVLLALARELRLDYEVIFGYLNDDLTRRSPTRDLCLRLLARDAEEGARLREAMGESAPLFAHGLLQHCDTVLHNSWLSTGICITPLAAALLGNAGSPQTRIPARVTVIDAVRRCDRDAVPKAAQANLARMVCPALDDESVPLIVLEGRDGSGRTRLAYDLAHAIGAPLLRVDGHLAATADAPLECAPRAALGWEAIDQALSAALLWQRLARAVVLIEGADAWFTRSDPHGSLPQALIQRLARARGPVLVRVEQGTRWHAALGALPVASVKVEDPPATERRLSWRECLSRAAPRARLADADAAALADRFQLTPGRIARIVQRVASEGALDAESGARPTSATVAGQLSEAARIESRDELGALAVRAPTPHGWDDLVLARPTVARLRDFCGAIRDRTVVLDRWGFGRRATRARGISALFAGASGTGKTMAASVIARELDLDLFVIDLSAVVSKYLGETEKSLDKVFRAARGAGAILFFDEADALFGKRSEVKDAHDRYANVEVAYLLQQLDAHDGIVILATNLSRNLDAAFSRRMRYVVEFPPPGEADRLRLWRGIFPAEAPLAPDVDLSFLAAHFPLAGGDIRNVALESAYLAAADATDRGGTIGMRHLVRAMAQQLTKQGKTPSAAEFRHFTALLDCDR
jgi:MoxR-like ATPase